MYTTDEISSVTTTPGALNNLNLITSLRCRRRRRKGQITVFLYTYKRIIAVFALRIFYSIEK